MWQRFTERARRVVFFAQEEAGRFGQNVVSGEHMLLGMLREEDSAAAVVLQRMGVGLADLRADVERRLTSGQAPVGQAMQLSASAKRNIDLAYDEARRADNNYIGSEHLLLGLVRLEDSLAGTVLQEHGIDLDRARSTVSAYQAERATADERQEQPPSAPAEPAPAENAAPPPGIGDLGTLRGILGREAVEVAANVTAFNDLVAAFRARDDRRYRALCGDGSVRILPAGTSVKLLAIGESQAASHRRYPEIPYLVRILDGEAVGSKGWIVADTFAHLGPDESPFPPEG